MTSQNYDEPMTYGANTPAPISGRDAIREALAAERAEGYDPTAQVTDDRERFGSLSSLDKLRKEAEKDITNVKEVPIPGDYRPGWSFIVDCIITGDQLEEYTRLSRKSRTSGRGGVNADDIDSTQLNCRVLINHVIEIRENGVPMTDEAGRKLNLRSPEFIAAMGKNKAIDALRRFVWDSHIGIMSDRVMDAAGYSRDGNNWVEAKPVNPTQD